MSSLPEKKPTEHVLYETDDCSDIEGRKDLSALSFRHQISDRLTPYPEEFNGPISVLDLTSLVHHFHSNDKLVIYDENGKPQLEAELGFQGLSSIYQAVQDLLIKSMKNMSPESIIRYVKAIAKVAVYTKKGDPLIKINIWAPKEFDPSR